jgi:hypothetical protein
MDGGARCDAVERHLRRFALDGRMQRALGHWKRNRTHQMRSKSQTAWETARRCAMLAQETNDPDEREHYGRLRDAWTTLAKRCEPFNFPDVTEK